MSVAKSRATGITNPSTFKAQVSKAMNQPAGHTIVKINDKIKHV